VRRKSRGEDVVVAAVQPEQSEEVRKALEQLERIPARAEPGAPPVDVEAVLRRRPRVCLIDGLAYRNAAGSRNAERWQDVEELLAAGISVISTINIQYVAERQREVEAIRGRRVENVVPERFLQGADEIEVVDAPPEYCLRRAEGAGDRGELERQLQALRQLALVLAADVVDRQLAEYLRQHGIEQTYGTQERILVCLTPRSNAALMVRRGRRQADRFQGELHVVSVRQAGLGAEDRAALERNLEEARAGGARVELLEGEDAIGAILEYARGHGITQIFVGHSRQGGWLRRWRVNPLERLILEAESFDVRVFPQEAAGDG
jgi:two-component system sensor histidine kinase KdpD